MATAIDKNEISRLLQSHTPALILENHEERRALALLGNISTSKPGAIASSRAKRWIAP
jgi:hypothetical protein